MANLAIIGSGVVGQATGKGFDLKGHNVIFVDVNPNTVRALKEEGYDATCDYDLLCDKEIDAFFMSVCTPTVNHEIQLHYIKSAAESLGKVLSKKHEYSLVTVRSTLPPGTTRNTIIPILEKSSGKKAGKSFGVCMNPEYLREESSVKDFYDPRLILIGSLDKKSKLILQDIYSVFNCPIYFATLEEAEIQKYIHNIFNACKISFFSEFRMIIKKMIEINNSGNGYHNGNGSNTGHGNFDIDIEKVFKLVSITAEASYNPKYGTRDMGPFGGSCLPKDTMAFFTFAKKTYGTELSLLKAVIDVNEQVKELQTIEQIFGNADLVVEL